MLEHQATKERARFWRADDIGDVELLHARYFTWSFAKHTHEGFAVGVIEDGAESFYYRGATHTAAVGSLIVFNPNEVHTGQGADEYGWEFRIFYAGSELLQKAASELSGDWRDIPFLAEPIIRDETVVKLMRSLHQTLEASNSTLERQSRFLWAFAHLIQRHADDLPTERPIGQERNAVRLVREYLEDNYARNVSLDEMAALAGLSSYHLIRVFRNEVGLPPHAYLQQVRIHRARQLLSTGTTLVEVAYDTGFVDQSHFTKQFKKLVGVTPGQYLLGARG